MSLMSSEHFDPNYQELSPCNKTWWINDLNYQGKSYLPVVNNFSYT